MLAGARKKLAALGMAVAAVAAIAVTLPAEAASTYDAWVYDSTKVAYAAREGTSSNVTVTAAGNTVTVDDQVPITPGPGCVTIWQDPTMVKCWTGGTPTEVTVWVKDQDDTVDVAGGVPGVLYGGDGDDLLYGDSRNDRMYGEAGDDEFYGDGGNDIIHGGDGQDSVSGNEGNDQLYGSGGNDRVYGGPGADVMSGDSGTDTVVYGGSNWWPRTPVTADLDGSAGDDGEEGERDTIGADFENLTGGLADDHLTGNNKANTIIGGPGNDIIYGGGGNDRLIGEPPTGFGSDTARDLVNGGAHTWGGDGCAVRATGTAVNCEYRLPPEATIPGVPGV